MTNIDYTGKLLVAQPIAEEYSRHFAKAVVLVAQHSMSGTWGVVVNNHTANVKMTEVFAAAGIDCQLNEEVYIGGPVEKSRVHVIHTMDWSSSSTLEITKDIGITGDISVLAAISRGEGPKMYRIGIGLAVWAPGQLEGEQSGIPPWGPQNRWLTTDATLDLVLTGMGEEQWQRAINECVNQSISDFF